MNADFLETQLVAYLSLREALGFQMRAEKILLPEFVAYVKAQESTGPIRAQMALEWACQASAHRGPERRRSTSEYGTGVSPLPPGLGARHRGARPRSAPHPTTAETVSSSRPRRSRPSSRRRKRVVRVAPCVPTPYPLCSVCWPAPVCGWARPSAYRSIRSNWSCIRRNYTSWRRSSINPALCRSIPARQSACVTTGAQRAHLHYDGLSDAFFVSEQGQPPAVSVPSTTGLLGCASAWPSSPPTVDARPCLMSFRHTFAVTRMQRWYQQGLDVQALLPHLSVYLGHVHPQESYWYLTAVPELLSAAAQRFQTYAHAGGTLPCIAA